MSDYGRQVLNTVGRSVQVIASDFADVSWKPGGITVDWTKIAALGADYTAPGGTTYLSGTKMIKAGTVVVQLASNGKYIPYDSANASTYGNNVLARGKSYITNEDIAQNAVAPAIAQGNASDHPGVFDGATVWKGRLQVGGSVVDGFTTPSFANFEAAFPLIKYVSGNLAADSGTLTTN